MTQEKREGDWKTPIGEFELGILLTTHLAINVKQGIVYQQINKNMYWVDDANSKYYNQLVDIAKVEKDWKSAEHLIDYPIPYEYLIEIKTNPDCMPGKGSAIFLHCTNDKPTQGCIAIKAEVMKKIIEGIDYQTKIKIDKGESIYETRKKNEF